MNISDLSLGDSKEEEGLGLVAAGLAANVLVIFIQVEMQYRK